MSNKLKVSRCNIMSMAEFSCLPDDYRLQYLKNKVVITAPADEDEQNDALFIWLNTKTEHPVVMDLSIQRQIEQEELTYIPCVQPTDDHYIAGVLYFYTKEDMIAFTLKWG